MAPKLGANHDVALAKLLEEGARSYLEAANALINFEREVQKKCRQVLGRHIEDYADALQVPGAFDEKDIEEFLSPSWGEKFDGSWRSVGVSIENKQFEPHVKWWGTYCTLQWEDGECFANISEWIGGPKSRSEELLQRIRKLGIETYVETRSAGHWHFGKELGVCQLITPEEASTFDEPLERLLEQWIKIWNQLGGMKGVFK